MDFKLTQYSTSGGCGCKVPNHHLEKIIKNVTTPLSNDVLSDFHNNEDAAIVKIGEDQCQVYSLDFFTPIVDDPETFGRIAAANAISDIYAKGATPKVALSMLGYPPELDNSDIPEKIMKGASQLCSELNISILGGHTIYNPQIIFGLSVTGMAKISQLKLNTEAKVGDIIYLTKPLGTGIMSTAIRKNCLYDDDYQELLKYLGKPNNFGAEMANYDFVHSMTDITGFGFIGHLGEICKASNVSAHIHYSKIKRLANLEEYIEMCITTKGGKTNLSNYKSYMNGVSDMTAAILSDPQSNGGLLICVEPNHQDEFQEILRNNDLNDFIEPIGEITKRKPLLLNIIEESRNN